jgi:hypothetical protein
MTASTHQVAICGRVYWPSGSGTKDIRKVQFPWGTITKAGGSALTISLQDVSLTAAPMQPDGTPDQTVAVANADPDFASNTWYTTGNFSADRTVSMGDLLAIVVAYDGAGRLGSDSVSVRGGTGASGTSAPAHNLQAQMTYYNGTSWATVSAAQPLAILEFSDGTFGMLNVGGYPYATFSTYVRNSGSSPNNEVGGLFVPPVDMVVDGAWWSAATNIITANYDIVVYDSAVNVLRTISCDGHAMTNNTAGFGFAAFAALTLSAGQNYYLTVLPTSGNNISLYSLNAANAAHLDVWPGGANGMLVQRGGAAFTSPSTTDRFVGGFHVQSWETGGGGGSGLAANPIRGFIG